VHEVFLCKLFNLVDNFYKPQPNFRLDYNNCFQIYSKSQFIMVTRIYDNLLKVDVKLLDPIVLKLQVDELVIAYQLSHLYVSRHH